VTTGGFPGLRAPLTLEVLALGLLLLLLLQLLVAVFAVVVVVAAGAAGFDMCEIIFKMAEL
jgi:hypothetical protein